MRELYEKLNEQISKVDFNAIWDGFSRYPFALYDENNVYLQNETIPYDQRFIGNTSIEYNGEYIAIWYVEDHSKEDVELLAADIVHEMFHAFQRSKDESRFPNDLLMLNYPENEENYAIKYSENLLLVKACLSDDINEKREYIKQFFSARKFREGLIGDIINQEYLSETIEGMADYAGCMALKQISESKYNARIKHYIKNLSALDERFFDIRRMLYYSGAIFCIQLAQAGLEFHHTVGEIKQPLFSLAAGNTKAAKPDIAIDTNMIKMHMDKNALEKKNKFDEFLLSHNEEVIYDSFICGYDPMNMIKMNDKILCGHFIMLQNEKNDSPEFIQGPVLVNLKPGSVNKVLSYIR